MRHREQPCRSSSSSGWCRAFSAAACSRTSKRSSSIHFRRSKRGAAFGVTAIATIVAPVLGPTLGGIITDNATGAGSFSSMFRSASSRSFSIRSGRGSALAKEQARPGHRLYRPRRCITLGLGCLQIMLDRGEDEDWFGSPFIVTMAVLAFLGIVGGDHCGCRSQRIRSSTSTSSRTGISHGVRLISAPWRRSSTLARWSFRNSRRQVIGYTATWAGLILSPGGIASSSSSRSSAVLMRFVQTRYPHRDRFFIMGSAFFYSSRLRQYRLHGRS